MQLLESLRSRSGKFRIDADCLVQLVLSFLGLLQDTSDVERAFATLELLELKRRVRLLPEVAIKDAIQIALEVPSQIGALVLKSPIPYSTPGGEKVQIVWRPRSFITKSQGKYASFWGSLRLQSRSLAPVSLKTRAAQLKKSRPRILLKKKTKKQYSGSQPGKLTKKGLRCKWDTTVKVLVNRMHKKKKNLGAGSGGADSVVSLRESCPMEFDTKRKNMLTALRAKAVADEEMFLKQEKSVGLARPVVPFRATAKTLAITAILATQKHQASVSEKGH